MLVTSQLIIKINDIIPSVVCSGNCTGHVAVVAQEVAGAAVSEVKLV